MKRKKTYITPYIDEVQLPELLNETGPYAPSGHGAHNLDAKQNFFTDDDEEENSAGGVKDFSDIKLPTQKTIWGD